MFRKVALVLSGFALVGYTGGALAGYLISENRDWLERTVIKLVEKYYELSQKVQELSQRIERLEKQVERLERQTKTGTRGEGMREEGIKEKLQAKAPLKIRSCPRITCEVAGYLGKDEVVSFLSRRGEWSFIERVDGVRGWVISKYLQEYSY
jgi:cell division protein FtsB